MFKVGRKLVKRGARGVILLAFSMGRERFLSLSKEHC